MEDGESAMKEHGILFSDPMVLLILADLKTQTRRLDKRLLKVKSGDRLWVRETWRIGAWDEDTSRIAIDYRSNNYARIEWLEIPDDDDGEKFNQYWIQTCDELATKGIKPDTNGKYRWKPGQSPCRWRSSRYMPRWAARIYLEATADARLEKVQEISEEDVKKEGFEWDVIADEPFYRFAKLWDSLNSKKGPWKDNPEVVVLKFRRIKEKKS